MRQDGLPIGMSVSLPNVSSYVAFLRLLDDYDRHDPENGAYYLEGRDDFAGYVQKMRDEENGVNLPDGLVPCSHRWLLNDDEIVGVVRVRHHIETPFLTEEAGHIGYDVPPSKRGYRFGVAALECGLSHAKELGLSHVLLFADTANPASWRTIEKCNGILEGERFSTHYQCLVRRYRITL